MLKLPDTEKSLWRDAYSDSAYPTLSGDIEIDVAVIGAGITGLTTAYLLKQAGYTVAVVDKHSVGGGTTGRTTGKVTSQHNLVYADLQKRLGTKTAQTYADANQAALKLINTVIKDEKIACDWKEENNYVYTTDPAQMDSFRQEAKVAASLGLPASFEATSPLPFDIKGAVRFSKQAKFHSQKYLLGLAKAIDSNGSKVFEHSTVIGIRDGTPARVKTAKGTIHAKNIVVATSVPTFPLIARGSYGFLEYPTESYIVAGRLNKELPGMYISPDKHQYSILPITTQGKQMLLIGGEGHFWGMRGNRKARYQRLAKYAQEKFGLPAISHHWSDRDYLAYDGVPLVGKLYPWSTHVYVGTGFKKWGLTNGTAAAIILCDLISGKNNEWAATFDSTRLKPVASMHRLFFK